MNKRFYATGAVAAIFFCAVRTAAQSITIPIETQHNALVLQTDTNKNLGIIYIGTKLKNAGEYNQIPSLYKQTDDYTGQANAAYSTAGSRNLFEPAIAVTHADGNNSLDLQYVAHDTKNIDDNISLLTIALKDPVYNLDVSLNYKTYFKEDVTEQWTSITKHEKGNVTLNKFASAGLYLKANSYWLRQYHGDWAWEMQPEEYKLSHGIKTLDSKLGTRANLFQPPVFMISLDKPATEEEGTVLCGALGWSGNFRIDLELDNQDNLRITAGINNYASNYSLKPGETFTTPSFVSILSNKGKGTASRQLHTWARHYRVLDGNGSRLTLLNHR